VPIHKDFHYQHVIVGSRLGLLDLDEMRFGDPAFDLAHFCQYLELLAVREHWPPEAVEPLTRAFLAEYARRTGWKTDGRFRFFAACACLKIAKQLATERGVWPRPRGPEQRAQLAFALERGLSLARSLC
jgi:aminoglycoside phosphotransferase (APT) family kinase protein